MIRKLVQLLILSLALTLFGCGGVTAAGFGSDDSIGTVLEKSNPVLVKRGAKTLNVGGFGLKLKKGDIVKTERGGQAQVDFKNGNQIFVASESEIELTEAVIGEEKEVSLIKLFFGKIRAKIQKTRKKRFRLKTTTATIGVKGTDFITEFVNEKTTVGTLDGLVNLASDKTGQDVDIPKGKMASVSIYGELMPLEEFAGELLQGVEFAGEKMEEDEFTGEKIEM